MENDDIDEIILAFVDFVKDNIKKWGNFMNGDWHGVFEGGTVVRIRPSDKIKFDGDFTGENYKFPEDGQKIPDREKLENILNENCDRWKLQVEESKEYSEQVKQAYSLLIEDGYPYPGQGSDRYSSPLYNGFGMLIFEHRNNNVFVYAKANDELQLIGKGGDMRRLDYMSPSLHALISPKLEIINLKSCGCHK
jgi:hypothetical protein